MKLNKKRLSDQSESEIITELGQLVNVGIFDKEFLNKSKKKLNYNPLEDTYLKWMTESEKEVFYSLS